MRILKFLLIGLVVLGLAALGYSYFFGGLRMKMQVAQFADRMATCEPFEQAIVNPQIDLDMGRAILGEEDGSCRMQFDALGGTGSVECTLPMAEMPAASQAFAAQSENIGLWGGMTIRFSTSDPDPWTAIMNSPACVPG